MKTLEHCTTLKDFKSLYAQGEIDKDELLDQASIKLDEADYSLFEAHVGA